MKRIDSKTMEMMQEDLDLREETIRKVVYESRQEMPAVDVSSHIVATYFIATRNITIEQAGKEIAQLETTNVRGAQAGSLLAECSGELFDSVGFDNSGKIGLVRIGFPLKIILDQDGNLYSTSILNIVAGAGVFALREFFDAKLVHLDLSDEMIGRFPGPAYGAKGIRELANFGQHEIAFGTIVKPSTGLTPLEEAAIVAEVASNPMFLFLKEDEHFFPDVSFAPLRDRLRLTMDAIDRCKQERGQKQLIFAPHIGSSLQHFEDNLKMAIDAGVNCVMFSEYLSGGCVRMVRELTKDLACPPAIYGHNAGIDIRTRHVYREVLDFLARLDGIDFRQTAPLTSGLGMLRPWGMEWRKCEEVLSMPIGNHAAVMIARSGGLDQGNMIPNLADIATQAGISNYLFLAGTAINGVKNQQGKYDPRIGSEAMKQILEIYEKGVFSDPLFVRPEDVKNYADEQGYEELSMTLAQRYKL